MKNLLKLLLITLALSSCSSQTFKDYKTEKIELRQLVNINQTTKTANASYFLILGSASYNENNETRIKLMGKVNGLYRLIEFNFEHARIKINNSIEKPYLYLKYSNNKEFTLENLLSNPNWYVTAYVIVCPEKYLPEQLLPITL